MARSLWTGSLSFGLVNVPIAVLPAVRDVDLHFRQIHEKDGAPIEVLRYCSLEDVEVSYEDIARSYELENGKQVIVTDEELEAVQPRRTRTIEIEQFVEVREVDPVYFEHPYFLVPSAADDGARRAYRLLAEAMARTDRAALGRFVMRAKEYLAIVRVQPDDPGAARKGKAGRRERDDSRAAPSSEAGSRARGKRDGKPGGALILTTMRFADEVRPTDDLPASRGKSHKPSAKQLDAAIAVIEELTCDWEPEKYKDRYRKRLREVVRRKQKGRTIKATEQAQAPPAPPDLMAALERTLADLA
jgi:DNA end-binding protein Ku